MSGRGKGGRLKERSKTRSATRTSISVVIHRLQGNYASSRTRLRGTSQPSCGILTRYSSWRIDLLVRLTTTNEGTITHRIQTAIDFCFPVISQNTFQKELSRDLNTPAQVKSLLKFLTV
ncbi:hypothetical protein NPIL_67901 [Nephila pilipes]|uniref:Uncharacterized protein n=1 Tax=Nephila pilipes TaxID=299642 RepID=A0A8X6PKP0_NEPPI|nr:hypothetical protein NPIL_67901 [Nephila pilipes]